MKIKHITTILVFSALAVMFVFGARYAKAIYDESVMREEIQSLIAGRTDLERFYVQDGYTTPEAYIAHGGGIGDYSYSNSIEGVQDALKKGFKFIEIDIQETTDGHLIGVHDWNSFKGWLGIDDKTNHALPYEQAKRCRIKGKYTVIGAEDIVRIMQENPDMILVTDKIQNFELLMREIPFPNRMIVEVSAENYTRALRAGVKYPAPCIWNSIDLQKAKKYQFPIVTMNGNYFFLTEKGIRAVQELHDAHVTILLFDCGNSCDNPNFLRKYLGKTVSKFYTNTWMPKSLP